MIEKNSLFRPDTAAMCTNMAEKQSRLYIGRCLDVCWRFCVVNDFVIVYIHLTMVIVCDKIFNYTAFCNPRSQGRNPLEMFSPYRVRVHVM